MRIRFHILPREGLGSGEKVFLGTALFLGAYHVLTRFYGLGIVPGCRFRTMTGLPCATCGFTRGLTRLADLDVAGALGMNPLVVPFALFFALGFGHLAWGRATGRRIGIELDRTATRGVTYGLIALFVATWVYQIACNRMV